MPEDKSAYNIERGVAAPEKITAYRGFDISTYTVYKIDVAGYSVEIWQGESTKKERRYLWTLAYRGEEDRAYIGYGEYMPAENLTTFAECVDDINSLIARVDSFPDYFEKSRYDWRFMRSTVGDTSLYAALLFKNKLGLRLGLEVWIYSPFWDCPVLDDPFDYSRGGADYSGEDSEKINDLRIECCGDSWYAPRDISALDDFIDALQSEVGLTLIS